MNELNEKYIKYIKYIKYKSKYLKLKNSSTDNNLIGGLGCYGEINKDEINKDEINEDGIYKKLKKQINVNLKIN